MDAAPFLDLGVEVLQEWERSFVGEILRARDVHHALRKRNVFLILLRKLKMIVLDPSRSDPHTDTAITRQVVFAFVQNREPHRPYGIWRGEDLLPVAEFIVIAASADGLQLIEIVHWRAMHDEAAPVAQIIQKVAPGVGQIVIDESIGAVLARRVEQPVEGEALLRLRQTDHPPDRGSRGAFPAAVDQVDQVEDRPGKQMGEGHA